MNYQTFEPHPHLASLVKCYRTLAVPFSNQAERQRIIPDGCIEMVFILGDDVKRYTSVSEFVLQPRAMILGQITEPFYTEPTGNVTTFAVRFYPYGFANFVSRPIKDLANKETPIEVLFGAEAARQLEREIIEAKTAQERIAIIEVFLFDKLNDNVVIDCVVKDTVNVLLSTKGNTSIKDVMKKDLSKRRQLERNFLKQIGISPKQLGKVIRLQAALKMLLNPSPEKLTQIAYESEYYDQAHFIKDFKEFTGGTPGDFLEDGQMAFSSLFYSEK